MKKVKCYRCNKNYHRPKGIERWYSFVSKLRGIYTVYMSNVICSQCEKDFIKWWNREL